MTENEFAGRNDRLISKWVFRFWLAVYAVLFVAPTAAFGAAPQTEAEIAYKPHSSGSLISGNREQADRDGANHFLHQSAMRSGKPTSKLFREPAEFLQGRRRAAPLKFVVSFQTPTIAYRFAPPEDFLAEAVRIWSTIHKTSL